MTESAPGANDHGSAGGGKGETLSVVISGQVFTSRTETIEDYLHTRVAQLGVIGLAGPFQKGARGRYTEYRQGRCVETRPLAGVHVENPHTLSAPFKLTAAFLLYIVSIWRSVLRLKTTWDWFIGISCFSAFCGIWLKRWGRVRRVIYYSIDYYPRPARWGFERFMVWLFRGMDRFCAKNSDIVWHISERIATARAVMGGLASDRYKHLEMPLSYRASLMRRYPLAAIERWTIGFVGTLTFSQGLQLLIEILPDLVKRFPLLKVRVIGRGPHARDLEEMAARAGCQDHMIFHGFVENEEEVLEIIAHSAIAVAPWTQTADNNILYADPGKPKLYMCLGVPCIITRGPDIADTIIRHEAGAVIDYNREQLFKAIEYLMVDDDRLERCRNNAYALGSEFISEKIIARAMESTLASLSSSP